MKKLFLVGLPLMFFYACEKDSTVTPNEACNDPNPKTKNHFPLDSGNYWVYAHTRIDTNGVEHLLDEVDSMIVTRDTTIRGHKYAIIEGTNYPYPHFREWGIVKTLRDSNGYLVNHKGVIQYALNDHSDTLFHTPFIDEFNGQELFDIVYNMNNAPSITTVPAGTFDVIGLSGTVYAEDPPTLTSYPRIRYNLYADGVGMVKERLFYFSSPDIYEKRLVRYHVNG